MYVLIFVALFMSGVPHTEFAPFETKQACELKLKELPAAVAQFNFKRPEDPIVLMHGSCQKMEQAPQGKGV